MTFFPVFQLKTLQYNNNMHIMYNVFLIFIYTIVLRLLHIYSPVFTLFSAVFLQIVENHCGRRVAMNCWKYLPETTLDKKKSDRIYFWNSVYPQKASDKSIPTSLQLYTRFLSLYLSERLYNNIVTASVKRLYRFRSSNESANAFSVRPSRGVIVRGYKYDFWPTHLKNIDVQTRLTR